MEQLIDKLFNVNKVQQIVVVRYTFLYAGNYITIND